MRYASPPKVEHWTIDKVFVKALILEKKGDYVEEHSHIYAHGFYVARGTFFVTVNGMVKGVYRFPSMIEMEAGVFHRMEAGEDNSVGLCIHNCMRKEIVEILEEAKVGG